MFTKSYYNSILASPVNSNANTQTKLQILLLILNVQANFQHYNLLIPQGVWTLDSLSLTGFTDRGSYFGYEGPLVTFRYIQLKSIAMIYIALSRRYDQ